MLIAERTLGVSERSGITIREEKEGKKVRRTNVSATLEGGGGQELKGWEGVVGEEIERANFKGGNIERVREYASSFNIHMDADGEGRGPGDDLDVVHHGDGDVGHASLRGDMNDFQEINLLGRSRKLVQAVQEMGAGVEEIDLEMGPGDDDPNFGPGGNSEGNEPQGLLELTPKQQPRKKKKVVKKWRDEWAETYKWAYVAVHDGTPRIFCSICKEYGRKHRRNPYGNEGSRNMQMSALEEHNNSLLHKEALRLQMASKDKGLGLIERPVYLKGRHLFKMS